MYTIEDGTFLVKLARRTIETYLFEGTVIPVPEVSRKLKEKTGVFVTLETYPEKNLRGCIGHIEPSYPLVDGTIEMAISAAVKDPRFPPVTQGEMEKIIVEVTILTPPVLIKIKSPKEYPDKIEIGRDGLIVEKGFYRGLLLPQVPVESGWSKEDFLSHTCIKAGLMADCWFDEDTKIYKFSGLVFTEETPGGKVVEKRLK